MMYRYTYNAYERFWVIHEIGADRVPKMIAWFYTEEEAEKECKALNQQKNA